MPGVSFACGHSRSPENTAEGNRCRICRNAYKREQKQKLYREDLNGYRDRARKRTRESGRRKRAALGAKPRQGGRKD